MLVALDRCRVELPVISGARITTTDKHKIDNASTMAAAPPINLRERSKWKNCFKPAQNPVPL